MSFYYGRDPTLLDSVMTLGGIDETLAISEIKYYDIDSRDFWSLTASDVLLDGESIGLCDTGNGCKLIFDTGTSLITMPSRSMELIEPYLYLDNCINFKNLPTFQYVKFLLFLIF